MKIATLRDNAVAVFACQKNELMTTYLPRSCERGDDSRGRNGLVHRGGEPVRLLAYIVQPPRADRVDAPQRVRISGVGDGANAGVLIAGCRHVRSNNTTDGQPQSTRRINITFISTE